MAFDYKNIDYFKLKLYQREREFNNFSSIDEEQLAIIAKRVYRRLELLPQQPIYQRQFVKAEYYRQTLEFLTAPNIHLIYKSFDERVAFLIMSADPNLITFREFIKTNIPSFNEIAALEDKKLKAQLFEERNQIINGFETRVREQLGFFDIKLLKFEEAFFKRFFAKKELITEVNQDNIKSLLNASKALKSFNSITDKRYQEIQDKVILWQTEVNENKNSKIAAYSVLTQTKLLGINTIAEQLLFFILATDPNLDMLRIYEEESMMQKTQERITEEFGYYHSEMLRLEKLYHTRFCPNKKVSIWTELKKTQN